MRCLLALALVTVACSPSSEVADASNVGDAASDLGLDVVDARDAGDAGDPRFLSMLLGRQGSTLVRIDGAPFAFSGAISCCGGAYGWPLFDTAWADTTRAYGVDFLTVRLGPFLTGPGGESDWSKTGGPYVEVQGKADLSQPNGAFWAAVRSLVEYAGTHGTWVEVDVADGWSIKHCRAGDLPGYSAWDKAWNVQAVDACANAGGGAIVPSSVHDAWVRKVFEETGPYGNVIYQDGNEIGLVPGYSPAWTASIESILRDVESKRGFPRHILGTNSGNATTMQSAGVDYVELHRNTAASPSLCAGKPCLVNEYNPDPPMTPNQLHDEVCAARANGTYFWYWRHGQSAQDMAATLALIQGGC